MVLHDSGRLGCGVPLLVIARMLHYCRGPQITKSGNRPFAVNAALLGVVENSFPNGHPFNSKQWHATTCSPI